MNIRWLYVLVHGRKPKRMPRRLRREKPIRDWQYRAWIRTLPSAVSGQYGCEAAHTGSDGGTSQKASDTTCIPLTPEEHREYHRIGRREFERRHELHIDRLVRDLNRIWMLGRKEAA